MTTDLQTTDFYGSLDAETRIIVQQRTSEIKTLMRKTAQDIIDIGNKLIEVKEKLGHGKFGAWLKAEFNWTATTAWRFMKVAEKFSNLENLAEIAPSALYLLADTSTPDSARAEALDLAAAGQPVTHSAAKQIVAAHKLAPIRYSTDPEFNQDTPEDLPGGAAVDPDTGETPGSAARLNKCDGCGALAPTLVRDSERQRWLCPACDEKRLAEKRERYAGIQRGLYYAVSFAEKVIYLDPFALRSQAQFNYPGCQIVRAYDQGNPFPFHSNFGYAPPARRTAPAATPDQHGLRYQPGMKARCTHPQCAHLNTSGDGGIYDNWTATDKPGVWRCPHGHRKADHLMYIITESRADKATRLSNSGPWTPGEKQYLQAAQNLAEANHERSVKAQEKRFAANGNVKGAVYPPTSADDAAARRAADLAAVHSSESFEWYTPARYIEAAREVLGEIDLDPASCALANETVKAKAYYDKAADGLSQVWQGRVWLNPPYGRTETNASSQGAWADYLIDQYQKGNVDSALLLISAKPSEKWFQPLWNYAICFVSPRINFDVPPGAPPANGSNHGSAVVYLGEDHETFARVFGEFGRVVIPAASLEIESHYADLDTSNVSIVL